MYMAMATSTDKAQDLEVPFAEALPPHLKGVLAELHRLDMAAAQMQPPDLVDDERAQGWIVSVQEPVIGLEVLERKVIDLITAAVVRGPWVRPG